MLSINGQVDFSVRSLNRAYALAEHGYPTEASLLAFATLDNELKKILTEYMLDNGMEKEAASNLLRAIIQKRISTYLDSILFLVAGKSLRNDDQKLFESVKKANKARNDAIHNGEELSRHDAYEILDIVFQVCKYLNSINSKHQIEIDRPIYYAGS